MSKDLDVYRMLGLPEGAAPEEAKSAYRKLARRFHPDVNPNNPQATVQFQDISTAHVVLTDAMRRRSYEERVERLKKETRDDIHFTARTMPSKNSLIPLPESQVVYLLTDIYPDPRAPERTKNRKVQLNLTLVLDRSNSMNGTRMDKVKIAANQIIDNLNEDDILSVVVFNDRSEVVIAATTIEDRPALKAKVSVVTASGGTEIFQGLASGLEQNRVFMGPRLINHIILLTDGHTFGDQEECFKLADLAALDGIGISAMGLGHDWNDEFLDDLAARTGSTSAYINTAAGVVKFLNDHVRNLSNAFAERLRLSVAPDPDVVFESAFRIAPNPQPLQIESGAVPMGSLQTNRPTSVLLQFQMPGNLMEGERHIARLVISGDILTNRLQHYKLVNDLVIRITNEPNRDEPPAAILDALSKLTLYRLQERAQQALQNGDVDEATKRLENLATRLIQLGQNDLANQAMSEARRVSQTAELSQKGRKTLKYQTRILLLGASSASSTEDDTDYD